MKEALHTGPPEGVPCRKGKGVIRKDEELIKDIVVSLEEHGFFAVRTISTEELRARLLLFPGASHLNPDLQGRGTVILAAFPYTRPAEPEDASRPGDPHALIAPFARRHYYREAVLRMKKIIASYGSLKTKTRLFSNSRLPEKSLAAAAGLGFFGKNGLIITEEAGSRFIIAGMITPLRSTGASHPPFSSKPGSYCGNCRLCIDACPVGALDGSGFLDRASCLQSLAMEHVLFTDRTMAVWGKRLYGCDLCQDPCPFNTSPLRDAPPITGELGASISIRLILRAGLEGEIKAMFRRTALGLSWMNEYAFLRNALLAAGASGETSLVPEVEVYTKHQDPVPAETARKVLRLLSRA